MKIKYTRLKLRRDLRVRKRKVLGFSQIANKQLDRHIFRRWHNFKQASRFAVGWISLLVVLIVMVVIQTVQLGNYYLDVKPVAGGVYSEGVIGRFSNANPIYATNDIDTAVSKILFDSLLTYDSQNNLVGDLASSWGTDDKGLVYTVNLKEGIVWHDGQPFTSDDVVFTYQTIQNPDAQSPLLANWRGIVIEKIDNLTVRFTLPNTYGPFLHSLTGGILPAHLLKDIPPVELRSIKFNTQSPIGTGPFLWKSVTVNDSRQSDTIQLANFDRYHDGRPQLDGITLKTYPDSHALLDAVNSRQVITAAGLDLADADYEPQYNLTSFNLMSANMLFLKTTSPLLADINVRQALIKATNVPALLATIGYPSIPVTEPILNSQAGYDPAYQQLRYDLVSAQQQLDNLGWRIESGQQYRTKNGQQLALDLAYENKRDFSKLVELLQEQWALVGINLVVNVTQTPEDSQKYIDSHDYDVLLYGISIGADPDVYVYWHSTQISGNGQTRLNFSEYTSAIADIALESGRSRSDANLRAVKYQPFLKSWQNDVPAIGLYQPRYLYVSNQYIYGIDTKFINISSDRFNNVDKWMINTARVTSE
jgi:peptide/nickel transport system substrate-binding protein